jgi:hypothetical protein
MEIRRHVPPAIVPPAALPRAAAPAAPPATPPAARPAALRDAALWDVLTPDERAYFEQQAALGPLTYGRPRGAATSAAPTGQRLDVRG